MKKYIFKCKCGTMMTIETQHEFDLDHNKCLCGEDLVWLGSDKYKYNL